MNENGEGTGSKRVKEDGRGWVVEGRGKAEWQDAEEWKRAERGC